MSWTAFAILAVLVALFVAGPLIRRARPSKPREEYDLAVYRDQIRELEEDVARGLLAPEQEVAARLEIDRRLLGATKQRYRSPGKLPIWQTAVLLLVGVPAVSLVLYLWRGEPGVPDQPLAQRADLAAQRAETQQLLNFIAEQELVVRDTPDDAYAWTVLGRAYLLAGRFDPAADAFRRALVLGDDTPERQLELVEALLNLSGGTITPEAGAAIDAALAADPDHPAARYYHALGLSQDGRTREAFDAWLALAADTPAGAPWRPVLVGHLENAADMLGVDLAEAMPEPPPSPPAGLGDMSRGEQFALIEQMVGRLAARLEENPGDAEGWVQLSQSYRVLGRYDEAREAVARAVALRPDDVRVLLQAAGIHLESTPQGAPLPVEAVAAIGRALAIEPGNAEAQYYAGIAARSEGDAARAREIWERLLAQLGPDSPERAEIEALLEELPVP